MVSEGHGGKTELAHPIGHEHALGQVGFGAPLPHVAGGKEHGGAVLLCPPQIGGQFVHPFLPICIVKFAVQVVDGKEVDRYHYRNAAVVADTVIVGVGVVAVGAVSGGGARRGGTGRRRDFRGGFCAGCPCVGNPHVAGGQ